MNVPNSHTEFSAKNANVKKNRLFKMAGSRKNSVHKYTQIPVKRTVHAPHDLAIMMISLTVLSYAMLMMEF